MPGGCACTYVCGEGVVDVLNRNDARAYRANSNRRWRPHRTVFADADLLFIAARATPDSGAAVWVLKPSD
jgi:hypothetical protein